MPQTTPSRPPILAASTALVLSVWLLATGGCQSAGAYREKADDAAARIIDHSQREALGRNEPFTIDKPSQTLRRRLMLDQNLEHSHPASLGVDQLDPIDHWPKDDYLGRERPTLEPVVPGALSQPISLTLTQSLQVAASNSRAYQRQKEDVFQAALALDLAADEFRNTYAGLIESMFRGDPGAIPGRAGLENTFDASVERRLKSGVSLSSRIVFDLAQLLTQDREGSLGILLDMSITVPLLAGSGRHIVTEPLTQAQRNVLYALWGFERFKRTLAVDVATRYLSVLQQLDQVDNAQNNYRRLIESLQRTQALGEAGRISEIGVDQVRQDVLRARNSWISARERYQRTLDQFKNTLGLPTDARIALDPGELARLAEAGKTALAGVSRTDREARQYHVVDGQVVIREPDNADAGRYELPEDRVTALAFERRLDLKVTQERVYDAQRDVVITADALRPGLNLTLGGTLGERRSIGSADADNAQVRFDEGNYDIGLTFDLPWEKTAERNAYRNALIDLEEAARSLQESEDQIKLQLRDALRSLREARESFQIQAQAVQVARRRVESVNLFLKAGRAQIRDLLEAEDALISAQDALTAALVDYRVSELELQRDMGVLEVNEQGIWHEYDPQ